MVGGGQHDQRRARQQKPWDVVHRRGDAQPGDLHRTLGQTHALGLRIFCRLVAHAR